VQVKDDKNNLTTAEYDHFGRRTAIVSPDAGRTEYVFDPASNLTRKITANLKAAGLSVNYSYQYNRLAAVTYPQNPAANAAYTYGGPGAANGQAGRIARMTAEGGPGALLRPLGEVVKEIRTPAETLTTGPDPVFTTQYTYDTWNRIQSLTYPDGEVLTFKYDSGGNLTRITGKKQSLTYPYLNFLGYDKFEARERVAYGNGTHQDYAYNPLNRRIAGLLAATKTNRAFMNMAYGYDAAGNVKTLANNATIPASQNYLPGCQTAFSFGYDDLYQLTSSTATCAKQGKPTDKFTLSMSYDSIHNITRKSQNAVKLLGSATVPNVTVSYDWTYTYGGTRPHAASQIGNRRFLYDLNGNQAGWDATDSGQNRRNVWDEDNRLKSVTDNAGLPAKFKYDDDTNRVVKTGTGGELLYVNPWYVAKLGRNSKHVFAGTTRIVTKLETFPTGEGYGTGARNLREAFQYFYHPDHLGSTAYATDARGEVYQHLEYFPFGESWVDEVTGSDRRVPYRFTGKELDPETKLYYFGARYYDPRTSVWESTDPALGAYLGTGNSSADKTNTSGPKS
jgi:RHS repeat-associated protein